VTLLYFHLRAEWGADRVAVSLPPESALMIRLQDDWWLQILTVPNDDFTLLADSLPWLFLGMAVLSVLIGWYAAHLARPLLALEESVADFARGGDAPEPSPGEGPEEIRKLSDRIHTMMRDLRRHERDRRIMLAGLPHDLRAPLTRLRLRLALMDEAQTAPMAQDIRAVEHIAEQFIGYLRGVEGGAPNREMFSLSELAAQLAEGYTQTGRAVELELDGEPVYIRADPLMFRRVIENLLQNAFHHGAPPVRLSVTRRQGVAMLEVEDGGKGIPEAQQERAMQPFQQLGEGRGSQGQVGLGLAVVRQILQVHGLSVELERSALGGLKLSIGLAGVEAGGI
jgi:two-component system osmolarity sensor histidine kinase EnvZ